MQTERGVECTVGSNSGATLAAHRQHAVTVESTLLCLRASIPSSLLHQRSADWSSFFTEVRARASPTALGAASLPYC